MKSHTIRLYPLGKEIRVNHNTPLPDVLHEYGIEFPCGGKGSCGKCKVKLLSGNIEIDTLHGQKLKQLSLPPNWRLACYSLCTEDITLEVGQFKHPILADESDFEFNPEDGYGVAVDLGTTTLVAQLIDLSNGQVLAVETMLNPQVRFGADLISRIQASIDGKAPELTTIIHEAVGGMIKSMTEKHPVKIQKVVIVGNTAMQLIFAEESLEPLAAYPFHTSNIGMKNFRSQDLRWTNLIECDICFFPSIGSFVGSDILAGIVATSMHKKDSYSALIDLGTNGEIVVGNKNGLVCASTAAGPAFEGANISSGMRAVTGAISSLKLNGDRMVPTVIGNVAPKGICGSALIDAVSLLRQLNCIGSFGEITNGNDHVTVADSIKLTQKDINEFQLAKAALAAGVEILTKILGINISQIETVYIAGGFGNYVNIENVVATGMVGVSAEKIRQVGNTALIGAKMFLFGHSQTINEILAKTRHVNLESDPTFQDIFVEKMMFPQ